MSEEILPDDLALRTGRRARVLAQMEADDLDILVLGRQANVRYVTGAPQLWVAGTRPFAPICVLVRATGEIHLNSSWDEGIPEEIGHDHLYGLAWNPMTLIEVLKQIDGAAAAQRVGTDAMSPSFAQLLPMAFPHADFVDGESAMKAARRIKTADELRVLRGALAVAERGLAAGALADGYVGEVGRTWPVGEVNGAETLFRRSDDLWERLVGACRPGASAGDLLAAYDAAGEALPPIPVAHGLGLGFDPPVVSPDLPATTAAERLDPGTVLALTAYVWQEGVGAVFRRDAVLITDNGAEVLTSSPSYSGTAIGAVNL
jgi:Xaa-Pro dipeptidase